MYVLRKFYCHNRHELCCVSVWNILKQALKHLPILIDKETIDCKVFDFLYTYKYVLLVTQYYFISIQFNWIFSFLIQFLGRYPILFCIIDFDIMSIVKTCLK